MIASAELAAIGHVRHGFFTREGGRSAGIYAGLNCGFGSDDDPARVAANRGIVAGRMGVPAERLLTVWQWHSADVRVVREPWNVLHPPRADAMVSDQAGIALGVLTADCTPVLLADVESRVVGAAHAGWKGALGGVIEATVTAMEGLGAARRRLVAVIGPTIAQGNYEVGPEFHARFVTADAGHERFFTPSTRAGHLRFDLPGFVRARLEALGLAAVEDVGLDTYGDEKRFFSYRRTTHRGEADYGRQISAIAIMD
jgi:YfiH family protein